MSVNLIFDKFQTAVEIVLFDEFHRNLRQMKGLGFVFQDFLEFLIFIIFSMFYTYLNIALIRILGISGKYQKWVVFEMISSKIQKRTWKFFFSRMLLRSPMMILVAADSLYLP